MKTRTKRQERAERLRVEFGEVRADAAMAAMELYEVCSTRGYPVRKISKAAQEAIYKAGAVRMMAKALTDAERAA